MSSEQHNQSGALRSDDLSHAFLDSYQLALHKRVAELLLGSPDSILARARENLTRWMHSGNFSGGEMAALQEWANMLDRLPLHILIERMTDPSNEGQRIRQSSPFIRILSREESRRIREECEKASVN